MTNKRSSAELAGAPARPPTKELKRTRLSPSTQQRGNSSEPSSCSVSEDSAARSTPPTSTHEQNSSLSSPSSDDESDTVSSLSTSSEESSDSEGEDGVHTIGGPKKPQMNGQASTESARDLQSRLSAFLPQLAAANQQLETDGGGHSIEDVEDGEQHIEMNLGLGVLEEKRDDGSSSSEESSDEDEVMRDEGGDASASAGAGKQGHDSKETHVLEKLKGERHHDDPKGGIQEIG
ncbi:hypothetical protein KC367_g2439 [Hortaea werneckii]|nr:hypothetical protein KC358_g6048 [Hortaea werneckii]KAI6837433.1 hypothetical protein KC342_g4633 [Hortaea werneckii]KAI6848546.1 hypothetical protein KC350_g2972 [Hortaea werneckii]KAI6942948.1 hypothetical protein KC341_g1838 [Hortaea werneckii]KAI6945057.1 hypothetical protein KC348_g3843 [Hortaea werneckii]